MMVMTARITFPSVRDRQDLVIRKIIEVSIESSWKELTDRAEITLPRNVKDFDKRKVKDVFRRGDPVTIELGYNEKFFEEFRGYIVQVSAGIPIIIRCEDEMWKLKQIPVNYSNPNVTLKKLLEDIVKGAVKVDADEVKLGSVRLKETTVAAVLDKLKQDWNFSSYMQPATNPAVLVCGKIYSDNTGMPSVNFHLERNIAENNLSYRSKEEVILKINATSILVNGKRLKFDFGEKGGDVMNLKYHNITTKAELEKKVKADYDKAWRDKMEGSITAFGTPRVHHGWKVDLTSDIYEDRNGTFYVDGVTRKFSRDGYRQKINIGGKV